MALPVGAVGKGQPVCVMHAVAAVVVRSDHVLLPGMRAAWEAEAGQKQHEQTNGKREVSWNTSLKDERW